MNILVRFLSVPIGGTVSSPARFNSPTEDDLREFIDLSLNLLCIAGTDGYFKHVNPAWETTFGYTREELLSRPYLEFVHPDDREATITEAANLASGRSTLSFENRYRCKDGSYRWLLWSAVVRAERGLIYAIAADITERKCEEASLAAQYAVTRVLAEAPTLASATPRILEAICESLNWSVGAIWRVDQKEKLLRCVETWHMSSAQVREFDQGTHSRTFPPGIGLPGRVWAQAQPAWIEDVTRDANFPRASIAAQEGLHAAFGFPILLGAEVLGVLEFFSHQIQQPDHRLLAMMSAIGSQIGQFIERKEAQDALRVYARDLETARKREEEATRAKSEFLANISAYLTKPIKQSELFDVIVSSSGEPVGERPRTQQRHKRSQPRQRRLHVLVAEDNQANQLLATRIFEKLGHQATVVSNGREAFVAFQAGKFDLIAMDVQMPEMDGLDATSAIRAWEKTAGTHTPIIAMTAHAMKGDRERCLAAGMDGYTSKPIRIGELEHAIAQLISPPNSAKVPVSEADQADGAIDHTALLAGVDGNRRVLRELVRLFLADCPRRLAEIKEAIRRGDAGALGRAAHTLKGSVGNFAAKNAFAAAQRLEIMGRDIDLDNVGKACVTLESELAFLSEELRKLTMNSSIRKTKTDKRGRQKGEQG